MPGDNRDAEIGDLLALSRRDPDVKDMLNMVMTKEGVDLFELAAQKPEVFDELYDSFYNMIAELGEYQELGE